MSEKLFTVSSKALIKQNQNFRETENLIELRCQDSLSSTPLIISGKTSWSLFVCQLQWFMSMSIAMTIMLLWRHFTQQDVQLIKLGF